MKNVSFGLGFIEVRLKIARSQRWRDDRLVSIHCPEKPADVARRDVREKIKW